MPEKYKKILKTKQTESIPSLIRALNTENSQGKIKAAKELKYIGTPAIDAIPTLLESLDDNDWEVRFHVIQALEKIAPTNTDVLSALEKVMNEDDYYTVRLEARRVLGEIKKDFIPFNEK
jgi:HEAT repeat protein